MTKAKMRKNGSGKQDVSGQAMQPEQSLSDSRESSSSQAGGSDEEVEDFSAYGR